MNYQIVFSELADEDLDEIADYIAQDNLENALGFVNELEERIINTLSILPNSGTQIGVFRYFSFNNYVVVYEVDENNKRIYIHLISEGHREWRAVLDERFKDYF